MHKLLLLISLLGLAACDLSPDMTIPKIISGEAFKESRKPATDEAKAVTDEAKAAPVPEVATIDNAISWKRVDEKMKIEEFAWWRMFKDPALDALEEQAMKDNPSLDVAAARMAAARAEAGLSDVALLPKVTVGAGPERQKPAAADINGSFGGTGTPIRTKPYTTYTAQGTITYELDLFGKNRNTARSFWHQAEAEQDNYRAARLALQANVAQTYFQYAALSAESDFLGRTLTARKEALELMRKRHELGAIDDLTLSSAETDFSNVVADREAIAQQLAVTEHLLATLVGVAPSEFSLQNATLGEAPPMVPAGIPSVLLERRPDIQAAAKQMASANARIGAARAGYFPDISLSAAGGYASTVLGDLFKSGNTFWALGGANAGMIASHTIFDGGRLFATLDERKAEYDGAVASYRASALQAFREVEDQLSNIRTLADQQAARRKALTAATRAHKVAGERYKAGYSSRLDYLDAERTYLASGRASLQVMGQRYVAVIQLVKALGGSWEQQVAPASVGVPAEAGKEAPVEAPKKEEAPAKEDVKKDAPAAVKEEAPAVKKDAPVSNEGKKDAAPKDAPANDAAPKGDTLPSSETTI